MWGSSKDDDLPMWWGNVGTWGNSHPLALPGVLRYGRKLEEDERPEPLRMVRELDETGFFRLYIDIVLFRFVSCVSH